MLPRSRWRTALSTASRVGIAAVAAAMSLVALGGPAAADPSDQPGGTTAVLDSRALDELQQRAAEVQAGLQEQQGEVVAAREALTAAEQAVADAEAVLADAEGQLATYQEVVASYASAVYRDGGALTPLTLLLSGGDPGDVLSAMGFLDAVDAHAAEVIGNAEESRRAALDQQQRASAALDQARARADEVATRMAELEAAATAVTDELDAALGEVDQQLSQLQQEQADVNNQTAANWKAYVDQLTAAGVTPPPAAVLVNPAAGLPAGLVPVGGERRGSAAGGGPVAAAARLSPGAAGGDAHGRDRGHGGARPALRARDHRSGLVGLRIARPVGLRPGRDPAARYPGRPVRRDHTRRGGRRAAR